MKLQEEITERLILTGIGRVSLSATSRGICRIHLVREKNFVSGSPSGEGSPGRILKKGEKEFELYFLGKLRSFSVPLDLTGTAFKVSVWKALLEIPYGETRTYGEIAARIGKPGAARAVGMACRENPVGIIVPCHRVIGAGGKLTGYAGGLDLKEKLLDLERRFRERRS